MTFALGKRTLNVKKLILIGRVDAEDDKLPTMAATLYGERTSLVCGIKQWFPSCGQTPEESMRGRSPSYFPHFKLEKTLMLGKIEGKRRRGWQKMRWWDGITDSMDVNLGKLQGMVRDREARPCCGPLGGKELDSS